MMGKQKVYIAAGYNTIFFGPGRPEFDPKKTMPSFESYLKETAEGTMAQVQNAEFDEGIIGSFMSSRFIKQANLPGFLPFMVPSLLGKPCTGVEGACATGSRAIAMAVRSILSGLSDSVFVAGFEMQNSVKSAYGADILAGAAYYRKMRKGGEAFYFPGIFAKRAGHVFKKYGEKNIRKGFAKWYEQAILNARKNPKAQEHHNKIENLVEHALQPPSPDTFLPYFNQTDCSKISDGASSLLVLSEEGIKKCGIEKKDVIEIFALGEAEGDITAEAEDPTVFDTMEKAVSKAYLQSGFGPEEIAILEIHDCFTVSAVLSLEAARFAKRGEGADFIYEERTRSGGAIPTNLSGGLCGFGHPTGATGVRQMIDLLHQLTGKAAHQIEPKSPFGMMINMGGDDKTVTTFIVRKE